VETAADGDFREPIFPDMSQTLATGLSSARDRTDDEIPRTKDDMADDDELLEEEIDEELIDDDEIDPDLVADDDDLVTDDLVADELTDDDDIAPVDDVIPGVVAEPAPAKVTKPASDDEDEDDDELDPDDVEEDLDQILKDRIAAAPDDEEDEEVPDTEDRSEPGGRVQPKRPGEFVCQSCFLVKHPSQLADAEHMLCADCV
jgi:hypothetical protein